jgi:CBS domain-containing protein
MMADTVSSILRHKGHDVRSVSPDDSVLQAMSLMADNDIGALVVTVDQTLVGIISERDYARKVVLQ